MAGPILNNESRATTIVTAVSVILSFTAVLVGLRLYTRAAILKTMGHDDWAIVVALVSGATRRPRPSAVQQY